MGSSGVDACPTGSEEITTDAGAANLFYKIKKASWILLLRLNPECETAATALGLLQNVLMRKICLESLFIKGKLIMGFY